jgi:hypothetical protein
MSVLSEDEWCVLSVLTLILLLLLQQIEAYLNERADQLLAVAPDQVEYTGTIGSVYSIPATKSTNRSSSSSNSGADDEESDAPSNGNANGNAALRPGATKGPSKNSRFRYPTAKASICTYIAPVVFENASTYYLCLNLLYQQLSYDR